MRYTFRPSPHNHIKKATRDAVIRKCGLLLPSPDATVASSTGSGEIGWSGESHRGREGEKKTVKDTIQTRPSSLL